jgi:hypothetical protein
MATLLSLFGFISHSQDVGLKAVGDGSKGCRMFVQHFERIGFERCWKSAFTLYRIPSEQSGHLSKSLRPYLDHGEEVLVIFLPFKDAGYFVVIDIDSGIGPILRSFRSNRDASQLERNATFRSGKTTESHCGTGI